MALVLLNRYLDVADAMEEQDQVHAGQRSSPGGLADLDNSDLAATDVPVDVPLPAMQHIGDAAREEVW
jgi:intraflagellar transport protein 172